MTTPITGDPTALRRAAGSIEAAAADLATHRGDSRRVRHAALAQWDGSASMAFGGTMATYGMDVDRNASALRALAGGMPAAELAETQAKFAAFQDALEG